MKTKRFTIFFERYTAVIQAEYCEMKAGVLRFFVDREVVGEFINFNGWVADQDPGISNVG